MFYNRTFCKIIYTLSNTKQKQRRLSQKVADFDRIIIEQLWFELYEFFMFGFVISTVFVFVYHYRNIEKATKSRMNSKFIKENHLLIEH